MDLPRRMYRALLGLLPARLRARHAAEMEDAFAEIVASARLRGRRHAARAALRAGTDVLAVAVGARVRARSASAVPRERYTLMLGTEIRSALRSFRRQRFVTGLVVAMLTLGIAANIVVFSLVNDLFLKPFPFPDPERLVYINEKAPQWNLEQTGINYPDFARWRGAARRFSGIALFDEISVNLSDEGGAERIAAARVTHDFFGVLGVEPMMGRVFRADEDVPKGPRLAVISERMWRDRFGGAPDVLGRALRLNGVPFEVIGVMPRRAEFPGQSLVWIPLAGNPAERGTSYSYDGLGRLTPGVSIAQAEQDLLRAHQSIWDERDKARIVSPFVRPLRETFVSNLRSIASALGASVALLLVVACANVAAVMLARAIGRRGEMGVRLAIGASRWGLMKQLFVENLLLASAGGIAGVAAGRWALHVLVSSTDNVLPQWAQFAFDWRIAVFSVLLAMATAMLFGWAPALHAVRGDLRTTMGDARNGGSTVSPRGRRTLLWIVAAEFALAAVLLVGGALLARAFGEVRRIDPGYRPDGVLLFSVALPGSGYADGARRLAFWDRLLDELRHAPGVESAGLISCPPLTCHWGNFYTIEGRAPLAPGDINPVVLSRVASDGYFEAMGIRLRSGRFFDRHDGRTPESAVVIVNETFVRTFWPNEQHPLGKRLRFDDEKTWITVVGVTEDVKHYGLERPMRPGLYFPAPMLSAQTATMSVTVRTTGDPEAFAPAARSIVQRLDASLPLFRVKTANAMLADSMRTRATYSWMLGVFAGLTLILAIGGAYGVTSYLATQRTREIGIRMAMGARSPDIVRAILRGSLAAIGAGIVVGLLGAMALAGLMRDLLFGAEPRDPVVLAAAAVVLVAAALLANWIPARRAARTDPMAAMRSESSWL